MLGLRTRPAEAPGIGSGVTPGFAWPAVVVVFLALVACSSATDLQSPDDLLNRLNALPDVEAREIEPRYGYRRAFQLDVTQPLDHDNPGGTTFTQRAYLSHVDEDSPMVFGTYGYTATEESGEELATILQANGLYVTHRFSPGSRPFPPDWTHLDIRQAAADHHRIATLLRQVYSGAWVSVGASKGGMAALFHRRFHPDDVSATVAYVSPLMFSLGDERFGRYLAQRGSADGRTRIHDFQRALLEQQDSLIWRFEAWFERKGLSLGLPAAPTFQTQVANYEWGFWQRHIFDYEDIPTPDESYDEWIDHLAAVVSLENISDQNRDDNRPYVYQAYTQLGAPSIDVTYLEALMVHEPLDVRTKSLFPLSCLSNTTRRRCTMCSSGYIPRGLDGPRALGCADEVLFSP